MLKMIKTSARQVAKESGLIDNFLCRKLVAKLFGSAERGVAYRVFASQAVLIILNILDSLAAWSGHTAPANAAVFLRSALPLRVISQASKSLNGILLNKKQLQRRRGMKFTFVRNIKVFQ